jgi:hypothetical protein
MYAVCLCCIPRVAAACGIKRLYPRTGLLLVKPRLGESRPSASHRTIASDRIDTEAHQLPSLRYDNHEDTRSVLVVGASGYDQVSWLSYLHSQSAPCNPPTTGVSKLQVVATPIRQYLCLAV